MAASSAAVVSAALRGDGAAVPLSSISSSGGMDLDLSSVSSASGGAAAGLSASLSAPLAAASPPAGTRLLPSCGSRMCTILIVCVAPRSRVMPVQVAVPTVARSSQAPACQQMARTTCHPATA